MVYCNIFIKSSSLEFILDAFMHHALQQYYTETKQINLILILFY